MSSNWNLINQRGTISPIPPRRSAPTLAAKYVPVMYLVVLSVLLNHINLGFKSFFCSGVKFCHFTLILSFLFHAEVIVAVISGGPGWLNPLIIDAIKPANPIPVEINFIWLSSDKKTSRIVSSGTIKSSKSWAVINVKRSKIYRRRNESS